MRIVTWILSFLALLATVVLPIPGSGTTAAAGPSPNPYAGEYTGTIVYGGGTTGESSRAFWSLNVSISATGRIGGIANYYPATTGWYPVSPGGDGSAKGSVSADGKLRLGLSDVERDTFSAMIHSDADGNLYGVMGSVYLQLQPQ